MSTTHFDRDIADRLKVPQPPRRTGMRPWQRDLFGSVFCWGWDAFFWMLGAGILHAVYRQIPPIGFGTAALISFFFGGASSGRMAIAWRVKDLRGEHV